VGGGGGGGGGRAPPPHLCVVVFAAGGGGGGEGQVMMFARPKLESHDLLAQNKLIRQIFSLITLGRSC